MKMLAIILKFAYWMDILCIWRGTASCRNKLNIPQKRWRWRKRCGFIQKTDCWMLCAVPRSIKRHHKRTVPIISCIYYENIFDESSPQFVIGLFIRAWCSSWTWVTRCARMEEAVHYLRGIVSVDLIAEFRHKIDEQFSSK